MRECNLHSLDVGRPGLTRSRGQSFAEAAAVCLETQNHRPGVVLELTGDDRGELQLIWVEANNQSRRAYADIQEATEEGACAIALVAIESTMGLVVVRRSRKFSAFDYWLGSPGVHLFDDLTRLEVSGILHGNDHTVQKRVEEKIDRFSKYPSRIPAIAAVVEFSRPQACIVKRTGDTIE